MGIRAFGVESVRSRTSWRRSTNPARSRTLLLDAENSAEPARIGEHGNEHNEVLTRRRHDCRTNIAANGRAWPVARMARDDERYGVDTPSDASVAAHTFGVTRWKESSTVTTSSNVVSCGMVTNTDTVGSNIVSAKRRCSVPAPLKITVSSLEYTTRPPIWRRSSPSIVARVLSSLLSPEKRRRFTVK